MILIPTMEDFFIAADKKSEFIKELIDEIIIILKSPENAKKDISSKKFNYIKIEGKDIYYEYFMVASQRVILKKQN